MEKFAGIPYDENAKMYALSDIKEFRERKRVEEAVDIFNDLRDFFTSPEKLTYLSIVASDEYVLRVIDKVEKILSAHEDYEKCSELVSWRKTLLG